MLFECALHNAQTLSVHTPAATPRMQRPRLRRGPSTREQIECRRTRCSAACGRRALPRPATAAAHRRALPRPATAFAGTFALSPPCYLATLVAPQRLQQKSLLPRRQGTAAAPCGGPHRRQGTAAAPCGRRPSGNKCKQRWPLSVTNVNSAVYICKLRIQM